MPRRRPPTADDRLRALRREAACVASGLARRLQHAPAESEIVGPIVICAFRAKPCWVFSEIDENQARYEGRDEDWFRLLRLVRDHGEWGPRLFESLTRDELVAETLPATAVPQGSDP